MSWVRRQTKIKGNSKTQEHL